MPFSRDLEIHVFFSQSFVEIGIFPWSSDKFCNFLQYLLTKRRVFFSPQDLLKIFPFYLLDHFMKLHLFCNHWMKLPFFFVIFWQNWCFLPAIFFTESTFIKRSFDKFAILQNLCLFFSLLTKFAVFPRSFEEIIFSYHLLKKLFFSPFLDEICFFPNQLIKFAFFSWPFNEICVFLRSFDESHYFFSAFS